MAVALVRASRAHDKAPLFPSSTASFSSSKNTITSLPIFVLSFFSQPNFFGLRLLFALCRVQETIQHPSSTPLVPPAAILSSSLGHSIAIARWFFVSTSFCVALVGRHCALSCPHLPRSTPPRHCLPSTGLTQALIWFCAGLALTSLLFPMPSLLFSDVTTPSRCLHHVFNTANFSRFLKSLVSNYHFTPAFASTNFHRHKHNFSEQRRSLHRERALYYSAATTIALFALSPEVSVYKERKPYHRHITAYIH